MRKGAIDCSENVCVWERDRKRGRWGRGERRESEKGERERERKWEDNSFTEPLLIKDKVVPRHRYWSNLHDILCEFEEFNIN